MPEKVSISTNGQSRVVPPGFRFHPTEEELLQYYLRKKIRSKKIDLVVIEEVDFNELDPWDIQAKCEIGSTPQNDIGWYFFCRNDKKYPSGNRATTAGVWKATGRDKVIYGTGKVRTRIGMRKTLVYYGGRAPLFHRSDWIMYEYRLIDDRSSCDHETLEQLTEVGEIEEGWVVCRIFKKKQLLRGPNISPAIRQGFCTVSSHNTANNLQKTGMCQYPCSRGFCNDDDQGQGQIFQHMSTKQPNSNNNDEDDDEHNGTISDNIEKLPSLLNPGGTTNKDANYDDTNYNLNFSSDAVEMVEMETDGLCDWLSIDQLLAASHLNSDHEQQQPTLS